MREPRDADARPFVVAEHPVIELVGVRKTYGDGSASVEALKGVNFQALPNRMTAIVGPSGSGKSTLLNMTGGLDTPTAGEIRFNGTRLDGMSETERTHFRAANIGFVFQFLNLLPGLTCAQNVMLGGVIVGMAPRMARRRAEELLATVGLGDKTNRLARELSGGQMQRVAIARALINDAPLLLADEPTGNLDEETAEEIMALLRDRADDGRAVVLVTHNNELAARYADEIKTVRGGLIHDGMLSSSQAAAEHQADPQPLGAAQTSASPELLTLVEVEIGPLPDAQELLTVQRAVEELAAGGRASHLLKFDQRRATFSVPVDRRDEVVAGLATRLTGEAGGVHIHEEPGGRIVLDLERL